MSGSRGRLRSVLFFVGGFVAAILVLLLLRSRVAPAALPPVAAEKGPAAPLVTADTARAVLESCHPGVVVARQQVELAGEIEGRLDALLVEVGDVVRPGQVLARIDASRLRHELEAERALLVRVQAESRRWAAVAADAGRRVERRRALTDLLPAEDIARTSLELEEAEAQHQAGEAEARRIEANIARLSADLRRSEIRAPFGGQVAARFLDLGAMATAGTPIFRLIGGGERRARFAAVPAAAAEIEVGTQVQVEPALASWPGRRSLDAIVTGKAPEIDAAAQRVFFEARLVADPGAELLPVGTAVKVRKGDSAILCGPGGGP